MSASVPQSAVFRMLDECAPGHTKRRATHCWLVGYRGKTYRSLPDYRNIELGFVRKMVRFLGIDRECAAGHGVI